MEQKVQNVNVIRVYAKKVNYQGRYFLSYSFTKNGKKFYDVKFRKEVRELPTGSGFWLVSVPKGMCNISKAKPDKKGHIWNDVIWVQEVVSCVRDEKYEKAREDEKQQELDELFSIDDEELPF